MIYLYEQGSLSRQEQGHQCMLRKSVEGDLKGEQHILQSTAKRFMTRELYMLPVLAKCATELFTLKNCVMVLGSVIS